MFIVNYFITLLKMKLTKDDATLFFKLMNNLLCYVNKKANIVTNKKLESYKDFTIESVSLEQASELQRELFLDI